MLKCNPKVFILIGFIVLGYLFIIFEVQSLQADTVVNSFQAHKTIHNVLPNLRKKISNIAVGISNTPLSSVVSSSNQNMSIPGLVYGTAWKKDRTKELVILAVKTGFRAIDTACQPKHYHEAGVGDALQQLYDDHIITRNDIFLQTKFTPVKGQDPNNIPYDETLPLPQQVHQSFQISCQNLKTDHLDALLLHSSYPKLEDNMMVWKAFEEIYAQGGARAIGLSNTYDVKMLKRIYEAASIKPRFLQNRFYRETDYDVEIRKYCAEVGIQYESFWTLTANPHITRSAIVQSLSKKYDKTPAQIFFRFVRSLGIVILTGTTSEHHMKEDLVVLDESFVLEVEELRQIARMMQ